MLRKQHTGSVKALGRLLPKAKDLPHLRFAALPDEKMSLVSGTPRYEYRF